MVSCDELTNIVAESFPDAVEEIAIVSGIPTAYVKRESILDVCGLLKSHPSCGFDYLWSLTASDWPDRLEVVYHLYSIGLKHYAALKVKLPRAEPAIRSVVEIWKAADWQEREVYDMFGIEFESHPDLRRILMDPEWDGFPLRKDYVER